MRPGKIESFLLGSGGLISTDGQPRASRLSQLRGQLEMWGIGPAQEWTIARKSHGCGVVSWTRRSTEVARVSHTWLDFTWLDQFLTGWPENNINLLFPCVIIIYSLFSDIHYNQFNSILLLYLPHSPQKPPLVCLLKFSYFSLPIVRWSSFWLNVRCHPHQFWLRTKWPETKV